MSVSHFVLFSFCLSFISPVLGLIATASAKGDTAEHRSDTLVAQSRSPSLMLIFSAHCQTWPDGGVVFPLPTHRFRHSIYISCLLSLDRMTMSIPHGTRVSLEASVSAFQMATLSPHVSKEFYILFVVNFIKIYLLI